jgi:hypothetical protein
MIMAKDKLNDGTLLGTLHDDDFSTLKDRVEGQVANKINDKIQDKKEEILKKAMGEE